VRGWIPQFLWLSVCLAGAVCRVPHVAELHRSSVAQAQRPWRLVFGIVVGCQFAIETGISAVEPSAPVASGMALTMMGGSALLPPRYRHQGRCLASAEHRTQGYPI
jgi:hypothetical protein